MDVLTQIEMGKLVAPGSGEPLALAPGGDHLVGRNSGEMFDLLYGRVPILLRDAERAARYVEKSPQMLTEYEGASTSDSQAPASGKAENVYTAMATRALANLLDPLPPTAFCLAVGGGPTRAHPRLCNLNIGPFQNVDVVGDAHELPYADESVDAIYCSAVIEHLHTPDKAVQEMFRVLKPGCGVFSSSPFIFVYHGYPDHYQNYTLSGHRRLFERQGFTIAEDGVSTGPAYAITQLVDQFIFYYLTGFSRWAFKRMWRLAVPFIRRVDRDRKHIDKAYLMASTTYVIALKP
ncbi:MAG: class I SAM-dependent methyltransferase [Rhodospirillales bacterium]|nr:MAG: class I SAM-dependent methyltransferase [Rhodospirillales bacterium]